MICAAKRMWIEDGDSRFDTRAYKVFEAIQSLEDAVFRLDEHGSAAAYKQSTAAVLEILGVIDSHDIHPDCADRRPADELSRMKEALARPIRMAESLGIPGFEGIK